MKTVTKHMFVKGNLKYLICKASPAIQNAGEFHTFKHNTGSDRPLMQIYISMLTMYCPLSYEWNDNLSFKNTELASFQVWAIFSYQKKVLGIFLIRAEEGPELKAELKKVLQRRSLAIFVLCI